MQNKSHNSTVRRKKNLRRKKKLQQKKLVINLWLNTDDGKHTVTNGNNAHTTYRRNRRKLIFLWKKSHHQSNKNRSKSVMRRVFANRCSWRVVKVNVFEKRYGRIPGEKERNRAAAEARKKKRKRNQERERVGTRTRTDSIAYNKYVVQHKWNRARGVLSPECGIDFGFT